MKNIYLVIICCLFVSAGTPLFAQYTGKKFVTGSASVNFGSANQKENDDYHHYSYNFDVQLGKFKTETRASGWRLSSALGGGKGVYTTSSNQIINKYERTGIVGVAFGVGRFWQYYKHFNEKFGIYAGPDVNVGYSYGNEYSVSQDNTDLIRTKSDKIMLYAGLSAGLYYRFSERWWVTGSLAFASPVSLDYAFVDTSSEMQPGEYKSREFKYRFSPVLNLPSVGLGVRFFPGGK